MTDLLTLHVSSEHGRDVLRVRGEIDLATAPVLEAKLEELQAGGSVVLDLTAVDFIDSTGLRVVLSADSVAREHGRHLPIVAGSGPVTRLFEITGVRERLAVFESVAAAAAHE